jgi:SNF2 family DNA or RNA helicase
MSPPPAKRTRGTGTNLSPASSFIEEQLALGYRSRRTPMQHQLDGAMFAAARALPSRVGMGGCLIADEMGLGKTMQALMAVRGLMKHGPILVIAPKSAAEVWRQEVASMYGSAVSVLDIGDGASTTTARDLTTRELLDHDLLLIRHSTLEDVWRTEVKPALRLVELCPSTKATEGVRLVEAIAWSAPETADGGPSATITSACEGILSPVLTAEYAAIVLDEAHAIRNPRTDLFAAACALRCSRLRIALTGTPVVNGVEDLWALMRFCIGAGAGTLLSFRKHNFHRTLDQTWAALSDHVRRVTKEELRRQKEPPPESTGQTSMCGFAGVPDAISRVVTVEKTPLLSRVIAALCSGGPARLPTGHTTGLARIQGLRQASECLDEPGIAMRSLCPRALLRTASREMHPKMSFLLSWLLEPTRRSKKTVVFCNFRSAAHSYARAARSAGMRSWTITGDSDRRARTRALREFRRGDPPAILVSTRCMELGVNLTCATSVVMLSPWWHVSSERQCCARVHRFGQSNPVEVLHLVLKDSVDEWVRLISSSKEEAVNTSLVSRLLRRVYSGSGSASL